MPAELPHAIAFLLNEFRGDSLHMDRVRRMFTDKGFVKDLGEQARAGLRWFSWADMNAPKRGELVLYATGGLNPFSGHAKCNCVTCRVSYAYHFAATTCLYADRVIVSDAVTWSAGIEEYDPQTAFTDLALLKSLQPLIEGGVVQFATPAITICAAEKRLMNETARRIATEMLASFMDSVEVSTVTFNGRRRLAFGSPLMQNTLHAVSFSVAMPTRLRLRTGQVVGGARARKLAENYRSQIREIFRSHASDLVYDATVGMLCQATYAAGDRLAASGLRRLDRRRYYSNGKEAMRLRAIPLPVLAKLTPRQVLEVRTKADRALPAFRARLDRDLMSLPEADPSAEASQARVVAQQLRSEAVELQSELEALRVRSSPRGERLAVAAAAMLEIVALGTRSPETIMAATGTFATMMWEAHRAAGSRRSAEARLKMKPAYVLLTATALPGPH